MTNRTSTAVAVAALLIAVIAVPLALVALVRANDSSSQTSDSSTGSMPGMSGMSGGAAMSDHMAAAPMDGVPDATATTGGQPLTHTVDGDTWIFQLTTQAVRWPIMDGTRVIAWTFNGTVPGPAIRVPYGQKVRIVVKNELPEPTAVHWHGIQVPNAMDGVPGVTQQPIGVGKSFTYTFRASPAGGGLGGTFFYHSHFDEDRQVGLGLSAPFIIVPPHAPTYAVDRTLMLGEWNLDPLSGATRPPMDMEGVLPNYFTINGKSYPATQPVNVKAGQRVLLRFVGAGQFTHPMHLHGTAFTVIAKDGHPLSSPYKADVVNVAPGERYDVVFTEPKGKWVLHCHIGHHLTNDGESPGGLLMVVNAQ
jgi:FtsP/CotA-like multicopper oxidase with cupredoxin domain